MKVLSTTVRVQPGTYYVGDPCYVVPGEKWDEFCRQLWGDAAVITIDGLECLAYPTQYGDGVYLGSDGFEYGVDAGLIGLVPLALVKGVLVHLGKVVEFEREFVCERTEEGRLTFGDISHRVTR